MCPSWRKAFGKLVTQQQSPQVWLSPSPQRVRRLIVLEAPGHRPTQANLPSPLQTEPNSYLTLFFLFPKRARRKREGLGFCLLVCHRPRALLKKSGCSVILLSTLSIFSSSQVRINSASKRFINHAKFLLWKPNNNGRVYTTTFYYFQISSLSSYFPLFSHAVGRRRGEKMRFFMNGDF